MRAKLLQKRASMPSGPYDSTRPLYLRIGEWNPNNPYSTNNAMGGYEAGLSVYDLDEAQEPVAPEESEWAALDLKDRLRNGEPRFFVQGDLVGEGQDGEPLLSHVRVVTLSDESKKR